MKTTLFIKSYRGDFPWLFYCLKSIKKFCTGYHQIIVQIPKNDVEVIPTDVSFLMDELNVLIIAVNEWPNGYIFQQYAKLRAWVNATGDFIQYIDSDCIFTQPVTPESFTRDGKPIILKTPYNEGMLDGAECWREPTERVLGFPVGFEYMRRNGLLYRKDTLSRLYFDNEKFIESMKHIPDRNFSEFNMMGAFAEKYDNENYCFIDTRNEIPPSLVSQFWSWGGITDDVKSQIEDVLK